MRHTARRIWFHVSSGWAGTSFLAAPVMLGYWLAYQVEGGGRLLAAQLLSVTALAGAVTGLVAAHLHGRRKR